jgi:succinate dehydrogenase/fumarate reductase-like Fe-S protein
MITRKLVAWLNLAARFGLHVLTRMPLRPFRRGRDLLRFSTAVGAEGYAALDPQARLAFPSYMNCVQCGLCALACTSLQDEPASAWEEAWTFVAGGSRSLDRAALVAHELPACASATEAERVCPMGIPISDMAATIRRLGSSDDSDNAMIVVMR